MYTTRNHTSLKLITWHNRENSFKTTLCDPVCDSKFDKKKKNSENN